MATNKTEITIANDKLNETNLVSTWFKKKYIETNKNLTPFNSYSYFIKDRLLIGKGVQNIQFSLIKPLDFNTAVNQYTVQTHQAQDLIENIDKKVKILFPYSIRQNEYLDKFASLEEYKEYLDNSASQVMKSVARNNTEFIEMIFEKEPVLESLTDKQKSEVTAERGLTWTKTTDLNGQKDNALEVYEEIIKISDKFLSPNKDNSASGKYAASVLRKDQILVIPREFKKALEKAKVPLFNKDFYSLEGFYDVIVLDGITSAYLFDKDLIQIYPQFEAVTEVNDAVNLEIRKFYHFWLTFGTLKHAASHKFLNVI